MSEWVEDSYPGAVLVDSMALRRGLFDYSKIGKAVPIDAGIINALSPYQSNWMNGVEDSTGWNFSFNERRLFYYEILKFWNTVLCNLKPDIFVSYTWPHLPSDYPLYLLCKYYYSIPVVFIDSVPYLNDYYYTVGTSIEDLSAPFIKQYQSALLTDEVPAVTQYLRELRSREARAPKHIDKYYAAIAYAEINVKMKRLLRLLRSLIQGKLFNIADARSWKTSRARWGTSGSLMTNFDEFMFENRQYRKNTRLSKIYDEMTTVPDFEKQYVYFAASYQPEAISNLMPGVYEDVFLVIDILSAALPEGWEIWYKEHPNTFREKKKGVLRKSEDYYKRLSDYENIRFISTRANPFDLIDNAKAVATSGGTVGWESSVRGVPAMIFGGSWYGKCKSILSVYSLNDAELAVEKIVNGFTPDQDDLERYAKAIYAMSRKDLLIINYLSEWRGDADRAERGMECVADFLVEGYRAHYVIRDN
ncbi:hypothetical protein N8Z80_03000 [Litorivicinus sp.]|nr:hypothetical protein [Litorivicinus sp.]MDC1239986.1 hypothetical protein [Litorivicinus sp.]